MTRNVELSEQEAWEAFVLEEKRLAAAEWMQRKNVDRCDMLAHANAVGRQRERVDEARVAWCAALTRVMGS